MSAKSNFRFKVNSDGSATIIKYVGIDTTVEIPTVIRKRMVTRIGDYAFFGCTGLKSVTIPDGVTSIGDMAFIGCTGLTNITIPASVTFIGDRVFFGCTGLTEITVDPRNDAYHSYGNCLIETDTKTLIRGCKASVIPSDGSVTSIGEGAFSNCTGLTDVTIPDGVTSIESDAFWGCTGLTDIAIPDSVVSIGSSAFYDTGYYNNSSNWENGVLYIGKYLIKAKSDITGNYVIKDGTTRMANHAFKSRTGLTSVTIPDSVTEISTGAFEYCDNLTSVTIGNGVTSIGVSAFEDCYSLTSVTIGNSITEIDSCAFYNCKGLRDFVIPDSVTYIGDMIFGD